MVKNKESYMFQSQFGMFSSEGDEAVSRVIDTAKRFNMSWPKVISLIETITMTRPKVREMRDTAVLEEIFDAIGYDESVCFYER
jgi:hypothetical protein